MRTNLIFISVLLMQFASAQGNGDKLSALSDRVQQSEIIVEGRIVKQHCFRASGGMIVTSNYIVPLKWFKGTYRDTIELLTLGGQIGDDFTSASDAFGVNPSWDYFFFLKRMDENYLKSGRVTYFPVNLNTGLIIINENLKGPSQEEGGKAYHDLDEELYKPVSQLVGNDYKILGKNRRELAFEKQQRDIERQKEWRDSIANVFEQLHYITFGLYKAKLPVDTGLNPHRKQRLTFNIMAHGTRDSSFEKIVAATMFLEYDTTVLGGNLVTQGLFTAALTPQYERNYKVILSDSTPSMIEISLLANSKDTSQLVEMTRNGPVMLQCMVSPKDISALYNRINLRYNIPLMQGRSEFYDRKYNMIKPFNKVQSIYNRLFLNVH